MGQKRKLGTHGAVVFGADVTETQMLTISDVFGMLRIACATAVIGTLSGCTTIEAAQGMGTEVVNQAKEGNVLTAAFMGVYGTVIGLPVAMIVDVVTLGGALTPEESAAGMRDAVAGASTGGTQDAMVVGFAQGLSGDDQGTPGAVARQTPTTVVPPSSEQQRAARPTTIRAYEPNITVGGSDAKTPAPGANNTTGAGRANCLRWEPGKGDNGKVTNSCNERLNFRWVDRGRWCNTGCADEIRPGQTKRVNNPIGHLSWAACVYPTTPSNHGETPYACK